MNDQEHEIAHCDLRVRGELKLTNKRLFGRIRLTPSPDQIKNGSAIRTTAGMFIERDFDAPVSTIERLSVKHPKSWISWIVISVIAVPIVAIICSGLVAAGVFVVGALITFVSFLMSKKTVVFSFIGNGEIVQLPLPAERKPDIEAFIRAINEAAQKALK